MGRVALRPLALPVEHGAWALLLEPAALALLVAPSVAGASLASGAVAMFLARQPLKLAALDRRRGLRYPRTIICERLVCVYMVVAAIAFAGAGLGSLIVLTASIPFAIAELVLGLRQRNVAGAFAGAIAAAPLAAAIAIAGGSTVLPAATLAALVLARSIPSLLYVRCALGRASRRLMIAAHLAATGALALLSPWYATATGILLVRSLIPAPHVAKVIGVREVAYGALYIAAIVGACP